MNSYLDTNGLDSIVAASLFVVETGPPKIEVPAVPLVGSIGTLVQTSFGPEADANKVIKHLREVKRKLDRVFPSTEVERGLSGMMLLGTLAQVKRQNAHLAKKTVLFDFGMDPIDSPDNEHDYTVLSPKGYRISKNIGIVAPRTEGELRRQTAYISDAADSGRQA